MRTISKTLTLGWVFAALCACGPDSRVGEGDACTEGQSRCNGNTFQTCDGGVFSDEQTCGGSTVCSPTLGCAQCDPAGGNTCRGNDVVSCNANGTLGGTVATCAAGATCSGGSCSTECAADGVDLVYVVDDRNRFLSFNPRKLAQGGEPFTLIGTLACRPQLGPVPGHLSVAPFSMSVDREGTAWVLYSSGEIFKVSTKDASCQASTYLARQGGLLLFGMGFVTDSVGSDGEKLWLGGGQATAVSGGKLAVVDTKQTNPQPMIVGNLTANAEQSPELTGTNEAKLFGFYPGTSRAFVQEIDRTSGAPLGQEYLIPGGLGGQAEAWAFAQWGGKFYVFVTVTQGLGSNSTVRVIDRATGGVMTALQNLPYKIVGAGVSTCAPSMIE